MQRQRPMPGPTGPRRRAAALGAAVALALAHLPGTAAANALPPPVSAVPAPVPLPPRAPEETYVLNVGGLRVAEMTMRTEARRLGYTAHATISTAGAVSYLLTLEVDAWAEGTIRGGRWQTRAFRTRTASGSKRQAVEIRYAGERPDRVLAEPPFKPKPWQIEPGEQARTLDPLSAFAALRRVASGDDPCRQSIEVFDGRRVHRLVLEPGPPAATEGLRRCEARYQRVRGFKQKHLDRPDFPLSIDYTAHPAGGWQFLRATGDTPAGTAVIHRRDG